MVLFLFCDITTYLFLKMYCDDWTKEEEQWFLKTLSEKQNYDLYILLKPDFKGVQDGTRNFLEIREKHYETIKQELIDRECNFIEVGGDWKERFDECLGNIKINFNI